LLVFRSAANLIFALIVGLTPDAAAAKYVTENFDAWPRQIPPEGVFYIKALLYALVAWRWYSRDWRARWFVMFLSGATAAMMLGNYVADHLSGSPRQMASGETVALFVSIAMDLIICGYLACDRHLSQAFLTGLPPLIRLNVRDDVSGQWLENSLRFSVAQAASRDPGTLEVLAKLSEVRPRNARAAR